MAGFQIEQGTAHGRGFSGADPNGYLAKYYTWVTKAYASGGPNWYIIDDQSALGTDPYIVVCDVAAPVVNDYDTAPNGGAPKFLKVGLKTTEAGYVRVQGCLWWDAATHTGRGFWFGYRIPTYDDADFAYDFRGGGEQMILMSRLGTSWYSVVADDFVGDTNFLEDTTHIGTLQSGITAGDSVVLQLDTGEAANFTDDEFYFLYDFDGHSWVDYVKCTNVDLVNDQITIDLASQDFPAGAVIGSYPHRHYAIGTTKLDEANFCTDNYYFSFGGIAIPYVSSQVAGREHHNQTLHIIGGATIDYMSGLITNLAPDDKGLYACQRPSVRDYAANNYESYSYADGMNRCYVILKNVYLTKTGTMAQMLDYRTLTNDHLYLKEWASGFALLILNTEAIS